MAEHWCSQLRTLPARLEVTGRNWEAEERQKATKQKKKSRTKSPNAINGDSKCCSGILSCILPGVRKWIRESKEEKRSCGWAGIFPREHDYIFLFILLMSYIGKSLNHRYSLILCSLFSRYSTRNTVIWKMQESLDSTVWQNPLKFWSL